MMNSKNELSNALSRLWIQLSRKQKRQFFYLLGLMICASFLEVISIGAVVPFLAVAADPLVIKNNLVLASFFSFLGAEEANEIIGVMALSFVLTAVFAGVTKVILQYVTIQFSFGIGRDIGVRIYSGTLRQPYEKLVKKNSSDVIGVIIYKIDGVIYQVIMPLLTTITSMIMLCAVFALLLYINLFAAIIVFGGFAAIYILLSLVTRSQLLKNGEIVSTQLTKAIKSLQEGLGGIREVIIESAQSLFIDAYAKADVKRRRAQKYNQLIATTPKFAIETFAILAITAFVFYTSTTSGDLAHAIPLLGVIALGAIRLLPLVQNVYLSLSNINGGLAALKDVLFHLEQSEVSSINASPTKNSSPGILAIEKEFGLENVSYRYSKDKPWVLKSINLKIKKGQRVGFIGPSGGGKSTLLDILLGLITPQEGSLVIDGTPLHPQKYKSWQQQIASVPQNIFLFDGTVAENIVFTADESKSTAERIKTAGNAAMVDEFVNKWPLKYQAPVGERGQQLSGGQRQRIGLARALFKNASVLILDEATSALDEEAERKVMESIELLGRDITILMVAHRMRTLKQCDVIYEVRDGNLIQVGGKGELVAS